MPWSRRSSKGESKGAETSEQAGLEGDQLVYELDEWSPTDRNQLGEELTKAGVPFVWDASDSLVVAASDEEAVESILDEIEYPDALETVDGRDRRGRRSRTGSSVRAVPRVRPVDARPRATRTARTACMKAVEVATEVGVPYGLAPATWKAVVDHATELRERLNAADDEQIVERRDRAALVASSLRVNGSAR